MPLGIFIMSWSKLKQQMEGMLADSLQGRIQYHVTHYKMSAGHYEGHGRAWITLDGKELCSFSEIEHEKEYYRLADQLRQISGATDYTDPSQQADYYLAWEQAGQILLQKGVYSQAHFCHALREYLSLSISEILQSEDPVIRALGIFDRRAGKRRLMDMEFPGDSFSLAKRFYRIRCEAENL